MAENVTEKCECGHQIIAHSATDGCVYCGCDERWRIKPLSDPIQACVRAAGKSYTHIAGSCPDA